MWRSEAYNEVDRSTESLPYLNNNSSESALSHEFCCSGSMCCGDVEWLSIAVVGGIRVYEARND